MAQIQYPSLDWQTVSLLVGLHLLDKAHQHPQPPHEEPFIAEAKMLFDHCTCRDDTAVPYCSFCKCAEFGPEYAIAMSPVEVE